MSALIVSGTAVIGNHRMSLPFCGLTFQLKSCPPSFAATESDSLMSETSVLSSRLPCASPWQYGRRPITTSTRLKYSTISGSPAGHAAIYVQLYGLHESTFVATFVTQTRRTARPGTITFGGIHVTSASTHVTSGSIMIIAQEEDKGHSSYGQPTREETMDAPVRLFTIAGAVSRLGPL